MKTIEFLDSYLKSLDTIYILQVDAKSLRFADTYLIMENCNTDQSLGIMSRVFAETSEIYWLIADYDIQGLKYLCRYT